MKAPVAPPATPTPSFVVAARPRTPALCKDANKDPAATFPMPACVAAAKLPAFTPATVNPTAGTKMTAPATAIVAPAPTAITVPVKKGGKD